MTVLARIRLSVMILRELGWQPAALRGNGRYPTSLDEPRVRAGLTFPGMTADRSLEHFFGIG